jgi:hypothetical protein
MRAMSARMRKWKREMVEGNSQLMVYGEGCGGKNP